MLMSKIIVSNYAIRKKPIFNDDGLTKEIEYSVKYDANIDDGSGKLEFMKVDNYQLIQFYFPELNPEDRLADIGCFFPHSIDKFDRNDSSKRYKARLKKYSNHGIGTALLELMISDAIDNQCKAISQNTNQTKIQSLLRKHGFISEEMVGVDYFRLV